MKNITKYNSSYSLRWALIFYQCIFYIFSVFSIFTFLGRRIGDNVDSQYIIVAIIIIALCILLLGVTVKCILMIMKILKSQ